MVASGIIADGGVISGGSAASGIIDIFVTSGGAVVGTVLLVAGLARLLWPERRWLPVAASGFVALSPVLTREFRLDAGDLGLLAGGYFLGFALIQLPLGTWLDRHGPRKVMLRFVALAVLGCGAFALAHTFHWLLAARVLCGVGVSACLMAPLTGFRRWFAPPALNFPSVSPTGTCASLPNPRLFRWPPNLASRASRSPAGADW